MDHDFEPADAPDFAAAPSGRHFCMAACSSDRAKIHVVTCDRTSVHKPGLAPRSPVPRKYPGGPETRIIDIDAARQIAAIRSAEVVATMSA